MQHSTTRSREARTEGLRFTCTQCGHCCTQRDEYAHVYVDDEEVLALARLLGMTVGRFRRSYTFHDQGGWTQVRFEAGACPFLDRATKRCTVYAARPVQCRTFPFWRELADAGGWTDAARALCEGVGTGDVAARDQVESLMREMEESDGIG